MQFFPAAAAEPRPEAPAQLGLSQKTPEPAGQSRVLRSLGSETQPQVSAPPRDQPHHHTLRWASFVSSALELDDALDFLLIFQLHS